MSHKLYRSRTDRILFGVCGGLANYFGIDSTIMRVIMVLLALAGGIGVVLYIIMAFIVPLEGAVKTEPKDVVLDNVSEIKNTAEGLGRDIQQTFSREKPPSDEEAARMQARRRNLLGVLLVVIGVVLLLNFLGVFRWWTWTVVVALGLIAAGLFIMFSVMKKK